MALLQVRTSVVPKYINVYFQGTYLGNYPVPRYIATIIQFGKWLSGITTIELSGKQYSKKSYCSHCGTVEVE